MDLPKTAIIRTFPIVQGTRVIRMGSPWSIEVAFLEHVLFADVKITE